MTLEGKRIVVTGATGQVAGPLAESLAAAGNEVIAAARFSDAAAKERLESAGVTCATVDLQNGDLSALPREGVDAVLNFAVSKTQRWDIDLRVTAEAPGDLMAWCRPERFLHCSTTGVYKPKGHEPITEKDALGDNHAVLMPTYSIAKIAAETVVRFASRQFGVPTTIARLNVPYGGPAGGWPLFHLLMMQGGMAIPVHADAPSTYCPIHQDDIDASVPALLDAASLDPTVVNWGGSEAVSVEEWCTYLGDLTGIEPTFETSADTLESVIVDTTKMASITGPTTVGWQDGFRRLVEAHDPSLLVG
ncbi:NAD(P)-dependent oxidoreductase [Aquihabitans sp. G128]|uniref:NAD-dependent epimerase/dehydratase family protein n=1 Tax=Aquihabitans sp. G128 TaxID=2849779 RepID=UPI001C23DCAF|nr:NAD(P)-dependent oxidoreductase [Aquihabitans sp. G128]QXC59616.1 NAD(P)-dependent oxidoreductase [Aquihabitans sp. G128]